MEVRVENICPDRGMTDMVERVALSLRRVLIDLGKEMDADYLACWADAPATGQEKLLAEAAILAVRTHEYETLLREVGGFEPLDEGRDKV